MVVYDPNHRSTLWSDDADAREWTARIAQIADVLIASAEDGHDLMHVKSAAESLRRSMRSVLTRSWSPMALVRASCHIEASWRRSTRSARCG